MIVTYILWLVLLILLYEWQRFRRPVIASIAGQESIDCFKTGDLVLFRYTQSPHVGVFSWFTHSAMIYRDKNDRLHVVEFRKKNKDGLFKDGLNTTPWELWLPRHKRYGLVAVRQLRAPLSPEQLQHFDHALVQVEKISFEHNYRWEWIKGNLLQSLKRNTRHELIYKGLSCGSFVGYMMMSTGIIKKSAMQVLGAFAPGCFSSNYSRNFDSMYHRELYM